MNLDNYKNEEWLDIQGFPGYLISNKGRVMSKKGSIMTAHDNGNGYLSLRLWKNNKAFSVKVHRLVYEAFVSNPNKYNTVNHKDFNKLNNEASNLEWCTQRQNVEHAKLAGRFYWRYADGTTHKKAKKVIQYDKQMNYINEYGSLTQASKNTVTPLSSISCCLSGRMKYAGGFLWRLK